ncbi:tRNA(Ile)-lysidine synthetase [Enterococcus faecalis 13-SD-W-01]|nr:tRNA(Ile)-lysidine synthetase [Enterococcus faecalis 13-SD-W-01]
MDEMFYEFEKKNNHWEQETAVLAAVSGGVDSVVLLDLMQKVQQKIGFRLGVAHVDHQLRPEAKEEAEFLKVYCEEKGIPFHSAVWEEPAEKGIETAARAFRYHFFEDCMVRYDYSILLTAHHGDDQIETILMKLLRGGRLDSFAGIKKQQLFANGKLVRPLLDFSKEQLYAYAEQHQLHYFEDATNQLLDVQRNRLRHLVVPQLKKENSQTMAHFQQFSQQIQWADQLIKKQMTQFLSEKVQKINNSWQWKEEDIKKMEEGERYFFLRHFFDSIFSETQTPIKEQQLTAILNQMQEEKAQWTIVIGNSWQLKKEYQTYYLIQEKEETEENDKYPLELNKGMYLNGEEWVGLFESGKEEIPQAVGNWETFRQDIWLPKDEIFFLEKRQPGDRIALSEKLTKKISRYFIDNKIPDSQRKQSWVLVNSERVIYSLIPFAFSYLSIRQETDKIHYILLYKSQRKKLEGEPDVRKGY